MCTYVFLQYCECSFPLSLCDCNFYCVCASLLQILSSCEPLCDTSPSAILKTQLRLWTCELLNKPLLSSVPFLFSCHFSLSEHNTLRWPCSFIVRSTMFYGQTTDDTPERLVAPGELFPIACLHIYLFFIFNMSFFAFKHSFFAAQTLTWGWLIQAHKLCMNTSYLHCYAFALSCVSPNPLSCEK